MLEFEKSGSETPKNIVVMLHGYGADGYDLMGLAPPLAPYIESPLFICPHAPNLVAGMGPGREWFGLTQLQPEELDQGVKTAAPILRSFLQNLCKTYEKTFENIILIGFSQGTMMALEVGLRLPSKPKAIIGFSGALAGPDRLKTDQIVHPPVLLIHGSDDPVVPCQASYLAQAALNDENIQCDLHVSDGYPHTIAPDGLVAAAEYLTSLR